DFHVTGVQTCALPISDPEFEAFLLEVLADFAVTVPEIGTFRARQRPLVFLTSNAVRELSDALRRRCLYLYLDYPSPAQELEIVRARVPGIGEGLARRLVEAVQKLRQLDLKKVPSIAEDRKSTRLNSSHVKI